MSDDEDENEKEFKPGRLESELDQALAGLESIARTLGEFKKTLVSNGIDPATADRMAEMWFATMMGRR